MRTKESSAFTSVTTEGAILPVELLRRVATGDATLNGLNENEYHLVGGEKLNEAISRSWTRLIGAWAAFRTARERLSSDLGTTLTRDRWLLPLFQELGYGRLPVARGLELDGVSYPISHLGQSVPVHLVSFKMDLDSRTSGVAGAARRSPHSLVQEFLNKSTRHLWGFVSNGLTLRVLRDNASLSRQAYVAFDLAAMFDGEVYADFALLWLICHESRVDAEHPEDCWLEKWSRTAREQGVRALDQLRVGVEKAIQAFGTGFLAHPANSLLKERLRSGELDKQDYYRQLLRLVYRLLFLFVAEDRDLLHVPRAADRAKSTYRDYYSTARLRRLALRQRGTRHGDLWEALRLVMSFLGRDEGCAELALPALGSFLFAPDAMADLQSSVIANRDLLAGIRELSVTQTRGASHHVDFRTLRSEELGSIYEALLELHPTLHSGAARFELTTAAGHERKTTGSYYTSDSLVQALLNSSLEPLLDEAARKQDPDAAILALRICDPACGSGHFLVAAAHRVAKRLAAARTGDMEPSPEAFHHALRDVIGHCVFGVDVNPMAVELCKVALWMEAIEPGRPLSFLDHHIQVGNSLIGATPALMANGIPDSAFDALDGDDKTFSSALKKRNHAERRGQTSLALHATRDTGHHVVRSRLQELGILDDATISGVREKEERWRQLSESPAYRSTKLVADAWCAAFYWTKTRTAPPIVTQEVFAALLNNPVSVDPRTIQEVAQLANQQQFFHWHIAFPDVFASNGDAADGVDHETGWSGGFDCVLGNPPWDTLSPDKKEFFAAYDSAVRNAAPTSQEALIASLLESSSIAAAWFEYSHKLYSDVHFFKTSGRYRLFAPGNLGKGDFNVYRMFVELALGLTRPGGYASQLVPENLYNGANAMAIRMHLFESTELRVLLGFENAKEIWFADIDTRTKFCLYSTKMRGRTSELSTAFLIRTHARLAEVLAGATLQLPIALVPEFSPDARAIMEFENQFEIDIARKMYTRYPKFGDNTGSSPHRVYMREIDMGTDRELFTEEPNDIPVYEGRMVSHFDHRAKAYVSGRGREAVWSDLPWMSSLKRITPQWRVSQSRIPPKVLERMQLYRIGFCDVASPTNVRSLVAALIPPETICGHKVPTIVFEDQNEAACALWLAVANSFVMDFLVRKKVSLTMSYTILDSLPFPRLMKNPTIEKLVAAVAMLTCVSNDMTPYWDALAADGWVPPRSSNGLPGIVTPDARAVLSARIDAIVARDLFGLSRDELTYVLDTFGTVNKYDKREYGEFRTRRLVLQAYDESIQTSEPAASAIDSLRNVPAGAWQTPVGVTPDNLMLFAVLGVLHAFGEPVQSEHVRLATALVVTPALATALLAAEESREWIRAVGPEARPLAANVVRFKTFAGAADREWAETLRRLKAGGALQEDQSLGTWRLSAAAPTTQQAWVAGRAEIAVEIMSHLDVLQLEQNLLRFVKDVEDGKADYAVS